MTNPQQQESARRFIQQAVQEAVAQALGPVKENQQRVNGSLREVQTTVKEHIRQIEDLSDAVFGNPRIRTMGIAERLDKLDSNISTLVKERDAIAAELRGAKRTMMILGAILTVPSLQALGWLQPLIHAIFGGG